MKIFYPIIWLSKALTEPDGNGGKASFGRIFGGATVTVVLVMGWRGKVIPEIFFWMFMVLVGYSLISKVVGPGGLVAVLSLMKGFPIPPGVIPPQAPQPVPEVKA